VVLVKKYIYILVPLIGVLLGGIAGFVSLSLACALVVAALAAVFILKDYERSIYFLAFYAFIDFILRDLLKIEILASYWDELLLVVCFGLWIYKGILNANVGATANCSASGNLCKAISTFPDNQLKPGYRLSPIDAPILFFFGIFIVLFIINSPDMRVGLDGLRAVIQYTLWFFVAMQLIRSFEGAKRVLIILLIIGTLIGLHGIYQYIIAVDIPPNWTDIAEDPVRTRVFSILKSPNILGSFIVLIGPLSLAFAANHKVFWKKLIFLGAFGIMSACLLFTYSKMALFAYIAALGIYFLIKDKRLILVLIAAVVLICLFVPSIGSRIAYLLSPEYIISALKGGRLARWIQGLKILQENLFFGVGLGRFGGAVAMNNKIPGTYYMDNYYLKTAVEGGLAGLGAFLILVFNVVVWGIRAIFKLSKEIDKEKFNYGVGIFAGLVGVLVHNLVENVFEVPMMVTYFWLMAAILMFIGHTSKSLLPAFVNSKTNTDENNQKAGANVEDPVVNDEDPAANY